MTFPKEYCKPSFQEFALLTFLLFIIIKKKLERREECDSYLTHVCRHHCSRENLVKRQDMS